jgi:phospholipase/lecithinase/hemolysin
MVFAKRIYLPILALALVPSPSRAQAYTSVVVFGDSLSDAGNFRRLAENAYSLDIPGPIVDYTTGRFTDGTDTSPAARLYQGVWVEQLAASLPEKPTIKDSLDGGLDYAYADATTPDTTSSISFGPFNLFHVTVKNTGAQIPAYLATKPAISSKTLFVLWSGSNDVLDAQSISNATQRNAAVAAAANDDVKNIQSLISAGATAILVPNLAPLGGTPDLSGNATNAATATSDAAAYNATLEAGIAALPAANKGKSFHVYVLDVFSLFQSVQTTPALFGFENVPQSAQLQPVDPDKYLFWDDLHPTTGGHHQVAVYAKNLLTATDASTTGLTLSATSAKKGATVELTATVSGAGGTPGGVVTFYNGATPLVAAELAADGKVTVSLAVELASGSSYALAARYGGDAVHQPSGSVTATLKVVP